MQTTPQNTFSHILHRAIYQLVIRNVYSVNPRISSDHTQNAPQTTKYTHPATTIYLYSSLLQIIVNVLLKPNYPYPIPYSLRIQLNLFNPDLKVNPIASFVNFEY